MHYIISFCDKILCFVSFTFTVPCLIAGILDRQTCNIDADQIEVCKKMFPKFCLFLLELLKLYLCIPNLKAEDLSSIDI